MPHPDIALRVVDGEPVCLRCLFGDVAAFPVWPIGTVRSRSIWPAGTDQDRNRVSEIRLAPGLERFTQGLADERRLLVLWLAHEAGALETAFARGLDGKVVGPFASRSPARPNPIAATEVELVEVDGCCVRVRGLDAIDGTPVLDLKLSPARGPAGS